MDRHYGAWGSLVPRLGALLDDQRLNVRRNVATLAASLAGHDAAALEVLATIAGEAIRALLRDDSAADLAVLETVLEERDALPDEKLKAVFDEHVAQKLRNSGLQRDSGVITEDLLRLPSSALPLLPVHLLVEAFISDARRLAGYPRGRGDPVERDRLQARLARLATIENQAPLAFRNTLRSALTERLRRLRRRIRFPVLLVLLQIAPDLLEPSPEAATIATTAEIDRAARAGRPGLFRVIGRVLIFAFVTGGVLAMLMACVLTVSHGSDAAKILGNAALECLRVGFIAVTAVLPAAVLYTPSLGRSFRIIKSLRRTLIPAIAAGLVAVGVTAPFAEADATLGLVLGDSPFIFYLLLFAAVTATVSLVTAMVPAAVRAYIREGDNGEIWATACAAGPALGIGTVVCGIAALLGFTTLSQLWPLLIATAATAAVSLTNLEIAAGPTYRVSSVPERSWWPGLAVISSAAPPALALIGVVLSWSSVGQLPPQGIECRSPGAPCRREFTLQPGSSVTLTFDSPAKLRADFDMKGHAVLMVPAGKKMTESISGKHLIVEPGSRICVDQCEGYLWPWKSDWLRVLVTGEPRKVHLLGQFTAPALGPKGGETVDLREAATGVRLEAGAPKQIEVPVGTRAWTEVEGQGLSEDDPALLAVFWHGNNNELAEVDPGPPRKWHMLAPGTYLLCVYFHSIENSSCNLKDPNRMVFETGEAVLKISLQEHSK